MSEATAWAFFCLCFATISLGVTAGVTYYNLKELETMERLVKNHGIHPMMIKCVDADLSQATNFELCRKIIEKQSLSPEDMVKLRKVIEDD